MSLNLDTDLIFGTKTNLKDIILSKISERQLSCDITHISKETKQVKRKK